MSIKEGDRAIDFKLADQDGKWHKLSDYKGKWVVVYFYPKDDTPGCTVEACSMRDNMMGFNKLKAQVFGINTDNVKSHKKFAEKYGLNFPLLADEDKKVVNAYGVWKPKKFMGKEFLGVVRTSFLVNPEGVIVKVYERVIPEGHAQEVMSDIMA